MRLQGTFSLGKKIGEDLDIEEILFFLFPVKVKVPHTNNVIIMISMIIKKT